MPSRAVMPSPLYKEVMTMEYVYIIIFMITMITLVLSIKK